MRQKEVQAAQQFSWAASENRALTWEHLSKVKWNEEGTTDQITNRIINNKKYKMCFNLRELLLGGCIAYRSTWSQQNCSACVSDERPKSVQNWNEWNALLSLCPHKVSEYRPAPV